MKSSVTFLLIVICTVVLAAKQSQAKKGCNAYGMACYGGHGKRSLGSLVTGSTGAAIATANGNEADDLRPDTILQVFPNEESSNGEYEAYPRYRLIKVIKSWLGGHPRRPMEHINEIDYPISSEGVLNRDSNNAFN